MQTKVYIILLNYKGWKDTLECIESLYKLNYPNYQIIVVDNDSPNNSVQKIQDWAKGEYLLQLEEDHPLKHLSTPAIKKPIAYTLLQQHSDFEKHYPGLIIIQANKNNGFASGNNVGIQYALAQKDAGYIWILNNDTVVKADSLSHLVSTYEKRQKEKLGILGAKVKYYYKPDTLQCAGGASYNKYLAYSKQIGNQEVDRGQYDQNLIQPDLIIGACMFVSRSFVEDVGMLSEDYFLYYEEQDWAERARRKNYQLAYEAKAVVYHKEGRSIGGTQLDIKGISKLSDFYYARNKIIFTRKFYGFFCVITVYLSFILIIVNRIRRGQADRIPMLLKILLNPKARFENS